MLEIVLSVVAVMGGYEYVSSFVPTVPSWLIFPLLIGLAVGAYFLPFMWLTIVAVAAAAGFLHGLMSRTRQPVVIQNRRSGLPPLP